MEINKKILVGYCIGVASIIAMTGVALHKITKRRDDNNLNTLFKLINITDDAQNISIEKCNERIDKLNERVDSLEKSNKK